LQQSLIARGLRGFVVPLESWSAYGQALPWPTISIPPEISGRFQYYNPQVVLTRRTAPSPSDGKALAFVTLFSSQGAKCA
jgi:hypothetical protein